MEEKKSETLAMAPQPMPFTTMLTGILEEIMLSSAYF
jgi:hypothetical protein